MTDPHRDAGSATPEDLAEYWRMPSVRAARELARKLGVRRVRGRYPWFAIWQVEGLAPPARGRWEELKRPHLTATELAELLGESERSARRRDRAKPDASFPDPVPIRNKPKLWRRAQINAWCSGLPVPVYQALSKSRPSERTKPRHPSPTGATKGFDPFAEKRSAATANRKMTASTIPGKNDRHP